MSDFISLRNSLGSEAVFSTYGARWVDLFLHGPSGEIVRPVLGFDDEAGYKTANERYHGAIVGRVCGRISGASFSLAGRNFRLEGNDSYGYPSPNHLHGGVHAFHNREWMHRKYKTGDGDEVVEFAVFSPDGENGYPGNVEVKVSYILGKDTNTLRCHCRAEVDSRTPISLTNHTFFNLDGHSAVMDASWHLLSLSDARLIECNAELVPTGKILECKDQWFDFGSGPISFHEVISKAPSDVRNDDGFSLSFAIGGREGEVRHVATLVGPESGLKLDVYSDQPSIQVYTAYFMDGTDIGHSGCRYYKTAGIALEPQGYPDAVNHPEFPSIIVSPGKPYESTIEYRFD